MKTIMDDLEKSWKDLKNLEREEFKPEEEADVQCMLYHLLLKNDVKPTDILNHHPANIRERIGHEGKRFVDILLGKEEKPKVLVEIKLVWCENGIAQRFSQQIRSLSNDKEKLREIRRKNGYEAKLVAILYIDLRVKKSEKYEKSIDKMEKEYRKEDVEFLHNYDSLKN